MNNASRFRTEPYSTLLLKVKFENMCVNMELVSTVSKNRG
jgi:hypothetical protein